MKSCERELSRYKILVTGASGFIGPHLCRRLCMCRADVHALSRKMISSSSSCPHWWQGDLSRLEEASRLLNSIRPDIIIHLAGYAVGGRQLDLVLPTFHSNLTSTVNLLTAAAEIPCRRIVLAGSLEEPVLGNGHIVPSSPYAAAKLASSAYGRMFYALYGLPVVVARIFMTYGPGEPNVKKIIPYVINSLLEEKLPELGSGERKVDWIFVEDVVEGLIQAALHPDSAGQTIDLGSGALVSIREVVGNIFKMMNVRQEPRFGSSPDRPMEQIRTADTIESTRLIAWQPEYSLEQGLKKTIEWHIKKAEHEHIKDV